MPFFETAQGTRIYYEVHGDAGPPLVLLHGLGSCTRVWEPQIETFSRHFRLYLMDFPGHGQSDRVPFYSISRYADCLKAFMDEMRLESASIMGLSLGCAVALTFGLHHPERVKAFVLQGPVGGLTPPWLPWAWPKMLLLILYLIGLALLTVFIGKKRTVWLMNVIPLQTKAFNPLLYEVETLASPLAKCMLTLQSAYPPYIGKLHQNRAPILVLYGERDPFPRRYYQYIVEKTSSPASLVKIPDGKHAIALDNPAAYNQACLDFLLALDGCAVSAQA